MDLGGNAYGKNLRQALKEKLIGMQDIDRAVAIYSVSNSVWDYSKTRMYLLRKPDGRYAPGT